MSNSVLSYFADKFRSRKPPPMGELASARGSITSALGAIAPYNPDDLIGKRGYAVYDQMQRDAQVQACLMIKKFSLLSRGWEVHPASNDPEDIRVADFVRWTLEDMRGSILDVLYNALDALAKGFSVMESNYRVIDQMPYSGMIGLSSIKGKDPSTFLFETDEFMNLRSLRRTPGVSGNEPDLPPEKFVVYSYLPRYESPYGTSDLRAAYKHYWSKDVLTRFLNVYLEKYGSPTAKGSYKRGTPKQAQDELLRVLDKIQQETAIVIPEDVQVELMEAHRGGEAGYLQAIEFHDKQIAKAILSQTLMTDEGTRVGSFGLAKVHLAVLKMCLQKLKRDLEETVMREQVVRRLVDYNFNVTAYPSFSLGPLEDRDLESLTNAITKLVTGEVIRPDEGWIREYLGLPIAS
ncbi:MAG: phage portal protein family protein [Armatimonadota bacterium]